MADPITIAAVAAGASGFLSFKGAKAQAKAIERTADYNARVAENEAILLQRARTDQESQIIKIAVRFEVTK